MNAPFALPSGNDNRRVPSRLLVESALEALVALLDAMDPDPDIEPTTNATAFQGMASGDLDECEDEGDAEPDSDGEPSLGSLGGTWPSFLAPVSQAHWSGGASDEREDGLDDLEPSLGWTATIRQSGDNWTGPHLEIGMLDVEQEHDGREPDEDPEYSLGWHGAGEGKSITNVCGSDREEDATIENLPMKTSPIKGAVLSMRWPAARKHENCWEGCPRRNRDQRTS